MNLLENIFFEYFNKYYYQNSLWRAYCEHIIEEWEEYEWQICFFHFSLDKSKKINSFFAAKILFFIKTFYSHAFNELYIIIKYCIDNNIVISINSLSEYKFVIKFWNQNSIVRKLLRYIISKNIWLDKKIDIDNSANFFELIINTEEQKFEIQEFKNYIEVDKKLGLHSIPSKFGAEKTMVISKIMHLFTVIFWALFTRYNLSTAASVFFVAFNVARYIYYY